MLVLGKSNVEIQSIDLTRLPSISHTTPEQDKKAGASQSKPATEYSSREVSTPALLTQQLLQAHYIFCLHHGPLLSDLYVRMTRDKFSNALDRFWTRFARTWDVLLHGNPAADVFSGIKIASGGELGFGVGEEEWGSGEREVLEDLTRRTEGLVDLVAARFGQPVADEDGKAGVEENEALPWMGGGAQSSASDGVIFSGVNAVERHSLRDVSLWMRQIYTYGEHAYGVRDNPLRERRKRRRHNPAETAKSSNGAPRSKPQSQDPKNLRQHVQRKEADTLTKQISPGLTMKMDDKRPEIYPRVASHDHTTTPEETSTPPLGEHRPSIPPPIVSAAEQALQKATQQADRDAEDEEEAEDHSGTTLGIPDQYMKYLTFGLSTLAKPAVTKRPAASRQVSNANPPPSTQTDVRMKTPKSSRPAEPKEDEDDIAPMMTHLEPIPDGETLKARIAAQKRQEERGHFVIGFKGDLSDVDELSDDEKKDDSDGSEYDEAEAGAEGSRIVLRTLHIEVKPNLTLDSDDDADHPRTVSRTSSTAHLEPPNEATKNYRRLRVLLYIHRPFIFCFLFEPRTSSLQYTKFYKTLHRNLVPIHKPLLSSTDPARTSQRRENVQAGNRKEVSGDKGAGGASGSPIFDLIYDPRTLMVRGNVPSIPEPGTFAAEGIFTGSSAKSDGGLTRIEALNVHSQILNTLSSTRSKKFEVERTSRTARGWVVFWCRVPPSAEDQDEQNAELQTQDTTPPHLRDHDDDRVAILVRRAPTTSSAPSANKTSSTSAFSGSRAMSSMFGLMGSTEEDKTGGADAGWGPSALAGGVGMGLGVDGTKYVDGLVGSGR